MNRPLAQLTQSINEMENAGLVFVVVRQKKTTERCRVAYALSCVHQRLSQLGLSNE